MSYAVRIEAFEGPLDLLLYLIRKVEMDIYDIPIAQVTQQYLDYIEVMQMLDLEVAGDFLVMAATLMQIKARMLLPSPAVEEDDPRLELVRQLEEYQLFRQAATNLADREEEYTQYYLRESGPGPVDLPESDELVIDVSLYDLLSAFHQAIERVKEEGRYSVTGPVVKLSDQVEFLRGILSNNERVSLLETLAMLDTRLAMVVTIVAVLELTRLAEVGLEQTDLYGDIWLIRKTTNISFTGEIL